ncbi:hypothetical protein AAG906_004328 [Vitis piasezkii]
MLWDLVNKKLIRSRDVVFLENQLLDDIDKVEKPKSFVNIPISVDPVSPPINVNDEACAIDDVEPIEQVEQASPSPPIEISLRRSTKERQPSTRYPLSEYVMGVDFEEIFSLVVKISSIRVVLGLAAHLNLEIEQLDVKTAFLHGDLEEEIYMEQQEGFKVKGKENFFWKLRKSLYGLKYKIEKLKRELSKSFTIKDLGFAKQILGMKISRDRKNGKLWLSQEAYIEKILERCNMSKAKTISSPLVGHFKLTSKQCPTSEKENEEMRKMPYSSVVGSLMYVMVCTRPDIAHAVGVVSTSRMCLCFGSGEPILEGYSDANMVGNLDSKKFTLGFLMTFPGRAVSWQSNVIHLSKNSTFHSRSKHIDVRYHWICGMLELKDLQLEKMNTSENGLDMFMKSLPKEKLEAGKQRTGLLVPTI